MIVNLDLLNKAAKHADKAADAAFRGGLSEISMELWEKARELREIVKELEELGEEE
ncbi:MAG: hypothetical protein IIY54_10630 [Ruminococcus sp.]|nr:hypothetical protein [Ruminococcus sp.]MBQ1310153.1 hypothetical protein [Ruminococcus sp.]